MNITIHSLETEFYFNGWIFRMNPERFEHLLSLVKDKISKENTKFRTSISTRERLVFTIQFLARRILPQSLSFAFRIGKATVSNILRETCEAIYDSLKDTYLRAPSSTSEWLHISRKFEETCNFPHTVGVMNGKHSRTECLKHSGSLYCNFKGCYGFDLLAACDTNYCFMFFELGQYGNTTMQVF